MGSDGSSSDKDTRSVNWRLTNQDEERGVTSGLLLAGTSRWNWSLLAKMLPPPLIATGVTRYIIFRLFTISLDVKPLKKRQSKTVAARSCLVTGVTGFSCPWPCVWQISSSGGWRDNNHSMATAKNLVFSWGHLDSLCSFGHSSTDAPLSGRFSFLNSPSFYFSFKYGKSALRTLVICVSAYITVCVPPSGSLRSINVQGCDGCLRWLLTSHMWVTSCLGCCEYDCCWGYDVFDLISVFVLLIIRCDYFRCVLAVLFVRCSWCTHVFAAVGIFSCS